MPAKVPPDANKAVPNTKQVLRQLHRGYSQVARLAIEMDEDADLDLKKAFQVAYQARYGLVEAMTKAQDVAVRRAALKYFQNEGLDYTTVAEAVADFVAARDGALAFHAYIEGSALKADMETSGYALRVLDTARTDFEGEVSILVPKAPHATAISTLRSIFE